jgi:hypothetical protein
MVRGRLNACTSSLFIEPCKGENMDTKKVRNAGIVSVLGLALALGAGFASSMSVGAQSQTNTGNDKPDPMHPAISSISDNSITINIAPNSTREVPIDASTVVLKDGVFAGVSVLQVGDEVQVNPRITLPNGLEGHSASPAAPSQADPAIPDKSGQTGNASGSGQSRGNEGSTVHSTPAATPDLKNSVPPASTNASAKPGEGNTKGATPAATLIWVTSGNDKLLGGVVHWAQNGTVILNIPRVGYSEYVIHTSDATGYQKIASAGMAVEAANAADMKVGTSVVVLGSDGGPSNEGYFAAKAILVLPASGKMR